MAATPDESMNVIAYTTTTRHGDIWEEPKIMQYPNTKPIVKVKSKRMRRRVVISKIKRRTR